MVVALDGVETKEGREAEESFVGRGWHSPDGRTDEDGWPGKGGGRGGEGGESEERDDASQEE